MSTLSPAEIADWLPRELARLSSIHKAHLDVLSITYYGGRSCSWAVHGQGECAFGDTPEQAAQSLAGRIECPAKLAKDKREQAERLIAEADELEATP